MVRLMLNEVTYQLKGSRMEKEALVALWPTVGMPCRYAATPSDEVTVTICRPDGMVPPFQYQLGGASGKGGA